MAYKFGLINGRFQMPHKGHMEIFNEILLDGLIPIIVLGSSQKNRNKLKNPLTFKQRKDLIRLVYPNTPLIFIYCIDFDDWDDWYDNLIKEITKELSRNYDDKILPLQDNITVYHNNKEVDKTTFTFKGKTYTDTWYTDIFGDDGFKTKEVAFVKREDIKIESNARDIRNNLEGHKHLLDARIYYKLKEWGWCNTIAP
jgi:nicotinamide mononucleotide adenylyltransferase